MVWCLVLLKCCKVSLGQNAATLGESRPLTASCSYTEIMSIHRGLAEAICGRLSQPPVAVSARYEIVLGTVASLLGPSPAIVLEQLRCSDITPCDPTMLDLVLESASVWEIA